MLLLSFMHIKKFFVNFLTLPFHLLTQLPDTGDASYSELETQLTAAAAALIATLKELLTAAKGAPMEQRMAAVSGFTQTYQEFLRAGVALAAVCQVKSTNLCLSLSPFFPTSTLYNFHAM